MNNCKHNEENIVFTAEGAYCDSCDTLIDPMVSVSEVENIIELHKQEYDDRGVDDILNDVLKEIKIKFTDNQQ